MLVTVILTAILKKKLTTHGFLPDPDERRFTEHSHSQSQKNTAVCIKHWSPNYETRAKKGHLVPVNPPSMFSLPTSFLRQTTTPVSRNVQSRNVDAAPRRKLYETRNEKPDPDLITSWDSLAAFCDQLGMDLIKKEDRMILTEVHGDPPKFTFSLTLFRDLTISSYRGNTKISCNDLINGFTYKLEKYWQILEVLKRLGTSERNVQEEIKVAQPLQSNFSKMAGSM